MALVAALYFAGGLYRERVFQDPKDHLHFNDTYLLRHFRFPRREILDLVNELDPYIQRTTDRCHPIPTTTQVLVALRFYSSGTFQSGLGESHGIQQSSVCKIIHDITNLLVEKAMREIKMPANIMEITSNMQEFAAVANFPRIIGAIDGTHIRIKRPKEHENVYVNRKQVHSLNIMAVCDAKFRIINFNARYPGSSHDSFVWNNSHIRTRFLNGDFGDGLLLGDSGYPLSPFMMTPFAHPATNGQERFNRSHKRTRVLVEQCFGILKNRFRCLHISGGELQYDPVKCAKIAIACFLLHNYCINRNIPNPQADLIVQDADEDDPVGPGVAIGDNIRNEIVQNFFS